MKIKNDYMLRKVADAYVVVPIGAEVAKFNGMINLNDAGALLWQGLEEDSDKEQLVELLMSRYEVDEATALKDVEYFITELKENNLLA